MKNNDYIWLFGENLAKTANSNSFHFWKYIVNLKDNIKKFLILEKNNNNLKVYNSLNHLEKKFVIWKNSFKHFYLFSNADLLFVSLNYKDVTPDKFLYKDLKMHLKKSFVHLQNGVCGIEKLNERGNSYNNSIIRYLSYNSGMNDNLIKYNKFKDYQILYEFNNILEFYEYFITEIIFLSNEKPFLIMDKDLNLNINSKIVYSYEYCENIEINYWLNLFKESYLNEHNIKYAFPVENDKLKKENNKLKEKLKNRNNRIKELKESRDYYIRLNNEMVSSNSWKITKPLRIIGT